MAANAAGSALGFVVDFTLLWLFTSFGHVQYLFASVLSFLTGASVHFAISSRFAFPDSVRPRHEAYRVFLLVSLVDLILLTFLMFIAVDCLRIHILPARLGIALIIGTVSFFLHKHITFAQHNKGSHDHTP